MTYHLFHHTSPFFSRASRIRQGSRFVLSTGLTLSALTLWLWQASYLALAAVGYLPIVLIKVIAGETDGMTVSALWSWPVIKSLLVIVGGLTLLYGAVRAWPGPSPLAQLSDGRLHRITLAAVSIAVAVPTGYALTRLAWFVGIPLGVTPEFLVEIRPIVSNGLGLALMALLGAWLTVGLTRTWGEVFPSWLPGLGGREVPVRFAVNFALAVSVLVMVAGLFFVRAVLTHAGIAGAPSGADQQLAAWLPEMFWPLWAVALTVAALAYRERRLRGQTAKVQCEQRVLSVPPPTVTS